MPKDKTKDVGVVPSFREYATFSLDVYRDPERPPMPDGWSLLTDCPASPFGDHYFGAAYIGKLGQYSGINIYYVVFAHRGTSSILDIYADIEIFLGKAPYTFFADAVPCIEYVAKYITEHYPPDKNYVAVSDFVGHSLGAVLVDLSIACYFDIDKRVWLWANGFTFDNPGSRPIIQGMIKDGTLAPDALTRTSEVVLALLSDVNAINTCNAQLHIANVNPDNFPYNYSDIPNTVGSPGRIYYSTYFTIQQHRMVNFYNRWREVGNVLETFPNFDEWQWPVGFDNGYRYYIDPDLHAHYWSGYMQACWDKYPDLHHKYDDLYYYFTGNFTEALKKELSGLGLFVGQFVHDRKSHKFTHKNRIVPDLLSRIKQASTDSTKVCGVNAASVIKYQKKPTLEEVLNMDLDGKSSRRKQIYESASVDKKLYYAVVVGDVNVAQQLLEKRHANPNTKHGDKQYTLLQIAVTTNQKDMTKILLQYGANPQEKNILGQNAFDVINKTLFAEIFSQEEREIPKQHTQHLAPLLSTTAPTAITSSFTPIQQEHVQTSSVSSNAPALMGLFNWMKHMFIGDSSLCSIGSQQVSLGRLTMFAREGETNHVFQAESVCTIASVDNFALAMVGFHLLKRLFTWGAPLDDIEENHVEPIPEDKIEQTIVDAEKYLNICAAKLGKYRQLLVLRSEQVLAIDGLLWAIEEHQLTLQEVNEDYTSGDTDKAAQTLAELREDFKQTQTEFIALEESIYKRSYPLATANATQRTTIASNRYGFFRNATAFVIGCTPESRFLPEYTDTRDEVSHLPCSLPSTLLPVI